MPTLQDNQIMFTQFEPMLKNRFIFEIDGIPGYIVKAATLPEIDFEDVTIDYMNTKFKTLGKPTWNDITLTFYQPVVPSGAQAVMEWVRLAYESVTGRAGYSDFYKKDVTLQLVGPVGDIVQQWKLVGAFVKNANFQDVDWSSSEPLTITAVVRYDYAILEF